jgi:subtilisin family serine protease
VSVINLSLGMAIDPNADLPEEKQEEYINFYGKDEESFWDELFKYADKKNITCVIAAGNNNILTGFDPFQRSKYTIKVGAVDQRFKKAEFSNFGNYTNIYAPGVHIYSAKPNRGFEFLDGTSMATPIVAGSIALLKSKNRNITNEKIIRKLISTSRIVNNLHIINLQKLMN